MRYAPINVKPQGRVGGAGYPREIESATLSLGWDFDIKVLPWGREFDMAIILEDRNNLETSRHHFDHSAFPAQLRAKER